MSLGNEREAVIIDTDPGIDDAFAIMLMLSSPEVHVRAITLTHGNTSLQSCKRNIVTILTAMQEQRAYLGHEIPREELPVVAVGCEKPLKRTPITAAYFHGEDGLGEIYAKGLYSAPPDWESQLLHRAGERTDEKFHDSIYVDKPAFQTTERDAADEILHQLNIAPPLTVTILAVGPLTNVASAYQRDPVTFSRAKRVVIMGGAVDAPGNVTPTAEFNFCADPDAADIVMGASKGFRHSPEGKKERLELIEKGQKAPVHVVIFPLDSAEDGTVTEKDYQETIMPLNGKTPLGTFCCAFLKWTYEVSKKLFGIDSLSVYDAYTALLVIDMSSDSGDGRNSDPEFDKNWKSRYLDLRVETTGKYTLGMCIYDRRHKSHTTNPWDDEANNVQVIDRANGPRFTKILLSRIFRVADTSNWLN